MSGLVVRDLDFSYGKHQVLKNVGLELPEPGTLTALIGPNAAGKSTLFRLIAGLLKPGSGSVHLNGTDLATLSSRARLRRVCLMLQFFAANAALTVFDVVMMAYKQQLQGWRVSDGDMQKVGEALERYGIGHLAEAFISELSGGQAQMVSVAQALVRSCDVYLFDEPTSALDLCHQLDVLQHIREAVVSRGAIGMVALHDLNLAARFADHLVLIGGGQVLARGTPGEVLSSPGISRTYGVDIEITRGPREDLHVHAYPA